MHELLWFVGCLLCRVACISCSAQLAAGLPGVWRSDMLHQAGGTSGAAPRGLAVVGLACVPGMLGAGMGLKQLFALLFY